jgi:hypothetical protein
VLSKTNSVRAPSRRDVAHAARRPPRHPRSRLRRSRQPAVPGRAPSPCTMLRGLGILPAARMPWTVPYRPVHAADHRSVGSTPPYVRRSRWPCNSGIFVVTVASPEASPVKPECCSPLLPPPLPRCRAIHAAAIELRPSLLPTVKQVRTSLP